MFQRNGFQIVSLIVLRNVVNAIMVKKTIPKEMRQSLVINPRCIRSSSFLAFSLRAELSINLESK